MGEKNLKEIEGSQAWSFEKAGDNIEGELVEIVPSQYGSNYLLKTPSGQEYLVFGLTVIATKLARVQVGTYIKITYLGDEKSEKTGMTYKNFKVEKEE